MSYFLSQAKGGSGGGITKVQIPSVVIGTYTYNETAQGPTITGLDTTHCNVTGTTSATNVGSYTITISLKDPTTMIWNDISIADKVYTWSIGVRSVTVPTVTGTSFTYDGTTQGPTITDLDNNFCTVTGDTTATNVGSYSFTVALNDTVNTKWADDSTTAKSYSWSIAVKTVTVPTVSSTGMIYDGTTQSPVITNPDNAWNTMAGTSSATNAGSYSLTFALVDNVNTEWSDGTTADIPLAWTIAKADINLVLEYTSVTLDSDHTSFPVNVSGFISGTLTAESSDTNIATVVSVSSGVIIYSVNDTSGTAIITVDAGETANYNGATATIAVTAAFSAPIYGVTWDGTSTTAWSRTDDAASFTDPVPAINNGNGSSPFDNILPWSGMERVTDATVGTLVKIPKYYYKWTRNGSSMKLQISDLYFDGSLVSPAHADRGDGVGERDYVYVGRYHCASDYTSKTGVVPLGSKTRSAFRTAIHNLGSTIWQYDFAMYWTIMMLYLVEFADWNSQAKIGYGCGNNSATQNMGASDSMPYHTGTMQTSRTTYGVGCQYRYIEGLWDNVYDWCDGIYFSDSNVYAINNPNNFSDSANGTKVGTRPTSRGYISGWNDPSSISGLEYALYPSAKSGSDSTYVCDYCNYKSSGVVLRVGGGYNQGQNRGLFCLDGYYSASYSAGNVGSRLMKLP